jgi:hypothetical protein
MTTDTRLLLAWSIFAILTFLLFAVIHRRWREKDVWNTLKKRYIDSADAKRKSEAAFARMYGTIENTSLYYRMDRLILTSGIRKWLPWLTGERYLLILAGAFIAGVFEGMAWNGNLLVGLFLGLLQMAALFILIFAMAGQTYNEIEDATSVFVSILSNHAKSSTDIVTIMRETEQSMDGPLKQLIRQFLIDAERTGNVDLAFDYMKESTDNRQLQTILVNLKNCMHYQANYEEVLSQMMGQIAASLSAREERKNILFSMKLTLAVISIASVFIVWVIGKGLDIQVLGILTGNAIGQVILFVTGILYIFVVVKLFGTDKQ